MITRRQFLTRSASAFACTATACATSSGPATKAGKPNVIIIFTDDQGYNDLGCFGSTTIRTPNIDQMAAEGIRFTDFYSAAPVCTPSRAALMTGCYAQRISMAAMPNKEGKLEPPAGVLFGWSQHGIHADEVLLPELLKAQGYSTGCVGKWHLGHLTPFLPTRNGFDSYYGIPYSNDMLPSILMRNEEIIEDPVNQDTLTERYTEEAVQFITKNAAGPFFLYLPHNMPHVPLAASGKFRGKSAGGFYGDTIECIDWSTGQILDTLKKLGIEENTLIIYTSDNGPWLTKSEDGGSAFPLRAGKGSTFEGGMREPCVMRWPGVIPAGTVCHEVAATIDLMPTIVRAAGGEPPADRIIDGKDILPLMKNATNAKSPHEAYFYYQQNELQAVRSGNWKLRLSVPFNRLDLYSRMPPDLMAPESLYNLAVDPAEQKNVIKDHPDTAEKLRGYANGIRNDLGDSLLGIVGKNVRPIGVAT
jgi:arylsulfatase A